MTLGAHTARCPHCQLRYSHRIGCEADPHPLGGHVNETPNPDTEELLAALKTAHEALYPYAYAGRQIPSGWRRDVPLKAQSCAPTLPLVSDYDRAAIAHDRLRKVIASAEQAHAAKDSPTPEAAGAYPGWKGVTQPCDVCGKPVAVNAVSPSECLCSHECSYKYYGLEDNSTLQDEGVRADDIAWLRQLKSDGHCGEGTLERTERERANDRIDRIIATRSRGGEEPDAMLPTAWGGMDGHDASVVIHHEAGGAPGREQLARIIDPDAFWTDEEAASGVFRESIIATKEHRQRALAKADAILALWSKPDQQGREWTDERLLKLAFAYGAAMTSRGYEPRVCNVRDIADSMREAVNSLHFPDHPPSDQQGREQVIGELCEALDPVCGSLTVFPADLDEGDDEEREIYLTRRELKRIVRARDALKAWSAAQ